VTCNNGSILELKVLKLGRYGKVTIKPIQVKSGKQHDRLRKFFAAHGNEPSFTFSSFGIACTKEFKFLQQLSQV
jgi:hypothetical protein